MFEGDGREREHIPLEHDPRCHTQRHAQVGEGRGRCGGGGGGGKEQRASERISSQGALIDEVDRSGVQVWHAW